MVLSLQEERKFLCGFSSTSFVRERYPLLPEFAIQIYQPPSLAPPRSLGSKQQHTEDIDDASGPSESCSRFRKLRRTGDRAASIEFIQKLSNEVESLKQTLQDFEQRDRFISRQLFEFKKQQENDGEQIRLLRAENARLKVCSFMDFAFLLIQSFISSSLASRLNCQRVPMCLQVLFYPSC